MQNYFERIEAGISLDVPFFSYARASKWCHLKIILWLFYLSEQNRLGNFNRKVYNENLGEFI